MPKISVIVPIYNAGNKLKKCIKSILNQTFTDFELILVNDGSTDDSLKTIARFKYMDDRIVVVDKKNEGSILARRSGIQASKCKHVTFVDADDWIDEDMLMTMLNEAIKHDVDVVVCNSYKVLSETAFIKQVSNTSFFGGEKLHIGDEVRSELVSAYLHGHPFPANLWGKLYKRELLENSGKYLEGIKFLGEDLFFNLEVFLKAKSVKMVNEPLYYYRVGGITSKYMPYFFDDIIKGYEIQKSVIEKYYQDSLEKHYGGASIMLLNTIKTAMENLFSSDKGEAEIKLIIKESLLNVNVFEASVNESSIKYFDTRYLKAIRDKDVDYLYDMSLHAHKRAMPKRKLMSVLSKIV